MIADTIHGRVDTVGASELPRVQEIVNSAVEFWSDLLSQKYRIRFYFPEDVKNTLGSSAALRTNGLAGIQLVLRPEVRRRGNAGGQRLGQEQIVSGCEKDWKLSDEV